MYGWRARLGAIVPGTNSVMEQELHEMTRQLEGVCVYITRMPTPTEPLTIELERKFSSLDQVEAAAKLIAQVGVKAVTFGSTACSFVEGTSWSQGIIRKIEEVTKVPAVTPSSSVVSALKHLGVKKVGVATPYPKDINERLRIFLKENGFNVVDFKESPHSEVIDIGKQPPYVSYRLARDISDEAEAIFISCTDFRTIDIIDRLEKDTGKPVVSANQASMFELMNKAKLKDPIKGYGKLLERT